MFGLALDAGRSREDGWSPREISSREREAERPPGDRSSFAEGAERKIANFFTVEEIRIDCLIS